MRTFILSFLIFAAAITANLSRAQVPAPAADDATQQQIDKLSAQIQELLDAQGAQNKRIDDLEKKISDLTDKQGQPGAGAGASSEDLQKLADQIQEVDKRRQADNEAIVKELEKLDKALGVPAAPHKLTPTANSGNTTSNPGEKQNGYYYEVKAGDTLAAIAKAYRDQKVKVTTTQIVAANPGLNPNNLKVGQKIFIPDSSK